MHRMHSFVSVSYTHLDVYKRQVGVLSTVITTVYVTATVNVGVSQLHTTTLFNTNVYVRITLLLTLLYYEISLLIKTVERSSPFVNYSWANLLRMFVPLHLCRRITPSSCKASSSSLKCDLFPNVWIYCKQIIFYYFYYTSLYYIIITLYYLLHLC